MPQTTLSDILGDPALRSALEYNESLDLSERSIRILQCRVCDEVTGKMNTELVKGLLAQDFSEIHLRKLVEQKRKAANLSPITDTWEACLKFLKSPDNKQVAIAVKDELGKLSDDVMWALVSEMILSGEHNLAIVLTADYLQLPLESKALFLRFDPTLAFTYQSQIAFSDIMVTPLQDVNRREDGRLIIGKAAQNLLDIYIGPTAFHSWEALKKALIHAFLVDVAALEIPPAATLISPEKRTEKLKKTSIRFSSLQAIRLIQGLGGQHITGELSEASIEAIARFQKKNGLTVDGDLGPKTLEEMRKVLRSIHLFEGEVQLIMGFYSMWEKDVLGLFYDPKSEDVSLEIDQNISPLAYIKIGKKAQSQATSELVSTLMSVCSPLMVYQGENFDGPHRPKIDKGFLEAIRRIDDLAEKNGLKIIVTGSNAASFRPEGTVVGGAIVTPAGRSNHKVGHAIDMNLEIVSDGEYYNSTRMLKTNEANWDPKIRAFFKGLQDDLELRWGGSFVTEPDPVHIDDGLNLLNDSLRYEQRYQATQTAAAFEPRSRSLERVAEDQCKH